MTARTKYRGLIKETADACSDRGADPSTGTIVAMDGREVGEMRSSRGGLGLALLRIELVRDGKRLAAGDATIAPVIPAWMHLEEQLSP